MDEAEWLEGEDMRRMLHHARLARRASDRKLRLLAVACCRLVNALLTDARSRAAVEAAEGSAEGLASGEELHAAHAGAGRALDDASPTLGKIGCSGHAAALFAADPSPVLAAKRVAESVRQAAWVAAGFSTGHRLGGAEFDAQFDFLRAVGADAEAKVRAAEIHQARLLLLRDILGNPFRPVTLAPAWRTPDVLSLAEAAYEQRTLPAGTLEPEGLALLADALEEAGCDNADLLGHLRGPGPHVRGCWALDLVRSVD
jgi:hypothetical protein